VSQPEQESGHERHEGTHDQAAHDSVRNLPKKISCDCAEQCAGCQESDRPLEPVCRTGNRQPHRERHGRQNQRIVERKKNEKQQKRCCRHNQFVDDLVHLRSVVELGAAGILVLAFDALGCLAGFGLGALALAVLFGGLRLGGTFGVDGIQAAL